jgi:hypothetical protein
MRISEVKEVGTKGASAYMRIAVPHALRGLGPGVRPVWKDGRVEHADAGLLCDDVRLTSRNVNSGVMRWGLVTEAIGALPSGLRAPPNMESQNKSNTTQVRTTRTL